jgi:16S rRNA U516 pseudouridylate synthase RsuA-like enzyme
MRNRAGRSAASRSQKIRSIGLARALSKLGICSRSEAAKLIRAGRVKLNGALRRDPETPVHIGKDRIEMDGSPLAKTEKLYLALNKPRGVITTASDEQSRETVYDYLPSELPWIAPAGRLDMASEGLLLLTNDSEWQRESPRRKRIWTKRITFRLGQSRTRTCSMLCLTAFVPQRTETYCERNARVF